MVVAVVCTSFSLVAVVVCCVKKDFATTTLHPALLIEIRVSVIW